ncbi:hypothetical protein [Streptacidiphilus sp. EB103A]|uniref:hypothetical protein n=1 Tax=Streptacidiphilus sp. EB103A TaxID=3156275 RepID=UPI003511F5FC
MPEPKDTSAEVMTEVRRLCRKLTASDFADPGGRRRLDVAADCLWAAYGLTCEVTCGAPESTARIERARLHYQEHDVPPHEQFQELAGQITGELNDLTDEHRDGPQTRPLLDAGADSLRAAMGFLVSVLEDLPPRLGVDLGSEYLRRAEAAYRDLPGTRGPAGADPIHEHLQHASEISRNLAAAPR